MAIEVSFNADGLIKKMQAIPKQANFASAVALTWTAKNIQNLIKSETLPKNFNLKNTWSQRGIRISPATPENLQAEVYSKDWYLPDQDAGGSRSGREFWIPGEQFAQRTNIDPQKKVIPKKFRRPAIFSHEFNTKKGPRGGKAKAKPFIANAKSGAKIVAVRSSDDSRKLDVLYIIVEKAVNIRGRKFFEQPADAEYNARFQKNFDNAWAKYVAK